MIPAEPEKRRLRDSAMVKMLVIGALILLLLIPLAMVGSLVAERQARSGQAAEEVAGTWGRAQVLGGPVLTVPYLQHVRNEKGVPVTLTSYARFLPETLRIDGTVDTERRSRGIFEVAVYRTDLRWQGAFARPSFEAWRIDPADILWQDAYLAVGVPDMRGITSGVDLTWGNRTLQLAPGGGETDLWSSGLRVPVPGLAESKPGEFYGFAFGLGLNGSGSLSFLPLGKETRVTLKSKWPSPSFTGAFLPARRTVRGTGFEAPLERLVVRPQLPAAVAGRRGRGGGRPAPSAAPPSASSSSCRSTPTRRPSGRRSTGCSSWSSPS